MAFFLRRMGLAGLIGLFFVMTCLPIRSEETVKAESSAYAPGVNLWGRPGLILGDSFERFAPGTWILSTHYAFQSFDSGENVSLLPFGLTYMAADDLVFYAGDSYKLYNEGQGLNLLTAGGKWGIRLDDPAWQFSVGCDLSTGPASASLGSNSTDFIPTVTAAYVFSNGLLFNFEMGAYLPGDGLPPYIRFTPGFAYPLLSDVTALLELTGHQSQQGPNNPGSSMVLGIRGNGAIHLQGFFGLGTSGDAPSYYGGVSLLMLSSLFEGFI